MLERTPQTLTSPIAAAGPGLLPLEISGLTFSSGGRTLIDGLELTLGAGPLTVVMGPNGAGKTLLLRLMHGLITPSAGTITWGGQPMSAAVRRRQAMVFQRPVLLRRSVGANIDFVLGLRGDAGAGRRAELLDLVGLADHADRPARLLSGGEQQRLALARALAVDPEVLFLDEPTASLDPASSLMIEQIVKRASAEGTKVVFVTHARGQARRLAGEVVFVHRGRVAEHQSAPAFFGRPSSSPARDFMADEIVI